MNYNDLIDVLRATRFAQKSGTLSDKLSLIRKAFVYSKKAGENEMTLHFARILQHYYLVLEQDIRKGEHYQEEVDLAQYLLNIEIEVHLKHSTFVYYINRSRSMSEELHQELKLFIREYGPYKELNNFSINLYLYPLIIFYYYKSAETHKVIQECQNAINFFKEYKSNKVYFFYSLMVPALIGVKKYEEAYGAILEAQNRIVGKGYNLSLFAFYEVLNSLHWGKYEEALERTIQATQKKQINPALSEQWQIVKGYLQILSDAGMIRKTSFRTAKLIKDFPIFSKDKPGNYSNILILKTISAIQKNSNVLYSEQNKISLAAQKYFKEGSRALLFINMLLKIPACYFDFEQVKKGTKAELSSLNKMKINTENIEIVPFEVLWDICLSTIKEKQLTA